MTKGEVPTMASEEQATNAAAEQNKAAEERAAPVEQAEAAAAKADQRQPMAEAAVAAAVLADEPVAVQAPVEMASLAEAVVKTAEIDEDPKKAKKADDRDADADEAPVDLAMLPEVELLDAIAAADGARAMPGSEGEAGASLLGDEDGEGGFLIPLLAVVAVGLGVAVAVGGDDDDAPPAPPPPPPANVAPVITSGTTATIAENSPATTVVYDGAATDTGTITWTIGGADAAAFTIDAATGEVRFVASPDFEADASYTFTITATDSGGLTDTETVTVTVTDVAENAAPVLTSGATAEVEEGVATSEVVYAATATDADGDELTYSLSGADADAFEIDEETGEVRFVASPDFEEQDSYTFTVTVTDEAGATDTQEVTISVTDADDEAPVFSSDAEVDVDENIDIEDPIYTAVAADPDEGEVTYSLAGADADAFEIDAETGEVRFVASPDFEAQESYEITIVATDDEGDTSELDVTVNVNDLDDDNLPPTLEVDDAVSVAEDLDITTAVVTAVATDPEGGEVTFSLEGEDADAFEIDAEGNLTFVGQPDFETQAEYSVTIVATDEEGLETSQDVVITITDVADAAPVFEVLDPVSVAEDFDITTAVATAVATDPDGGDVTFSLEGEDADAFTIDAETGELLFVGQPDFETQTEYNVTIVATDDEGVEATQDLTVTITDVLDVIDLDEAFADSGEDLLTVDASTGDLTFIDGPEESFVEIEGFGEGDVLQFEEGAEISVSTGDDPNDLVIVVNEGGDISEITLVGVLPDDAGFIFDEETAELEAGLGDFIQVGALVDLAPPADSSFA